MEPILLRASEESKNQRLDAFLASSLDGLTRSQATRLIESGEVAVNGRAVSKSYKLAGGEDIAVTLPEPEPVEAVPQDIPLDVVYEDADVIVVNKPSGMVVHPAPGHPDGTLVNALLYHCAGTLSGIGGALRSGKPHDGRSPDYDDWTMNGDILFWNELLDCAFELSSMGIRVDPESLDRQLTIAGCDDRRERTYHKMLLAGQLPPTIGGGIGQSRLSMLLLGKAHIGEVQASVWDDETTAACERAGILLL